MEAKPGEISIGALVFLYWIQMWDNIGLCYHLHLKSWDEFSDFDFCLNQGYLPLWGWQTKKWALVGLTEFECQWASFCDAWKGISLEAEWDKAFPDLKEGPNYVQK